MLCNCENAQVNKKEIVDVCEYQHFIIYLSREKHFLLKYQKKKNQLKELLVLQNKNEKNEEEKKKKTLKENRK